jgi:hypothetical protein
MTEATQATTTESTEDRLSPDTELEEHFVSVPGVRGADLSDVDDAMRLLVEPETTYHDARFRSPTGDEVLPAPVRDKIESSYFEIASMKRYHADRDGPLAACWSVKLEHDQSVELDADTISRLVDKHSDTLTVGEAATLRVLVDRLDE